MDAVARPPKLHRRNGVYYYRARVPTEVLRAISDDPAAWRLRTARSSQQGGMAFASWQLLVGKNGEPKEALWVSLRQTDRKEAELAFARKQVELNDLFASVLKVFRRQGTTPTLADVERLARSWFLRMAAQQAAQPPSPTFDEKQDDETALYLEEELALAKGHHAQYNSPDEQFGDITEAEKLLIEPGFIVDHESSEFNLLAQLIQRARIELARRAIDLFKGDHGRPHDVFFGALPVQQAETQIVAKPVGQSLSSLITEYVAERRAHISSPKTFMSYDFAFRVAKDVVGADTSVGAATRDDWKRFVQTLKDLPPNYTKRKLLKGLTAVDAAALARKQNLPTLSVSRVQGYIDHVSAMLKWAKNERKIPDNPMEGLSAGKDPVPKEDKRRPFTIPDLQTLFSDPEFCGQRPLNVRKLVELRKAEFWAPLIGVFSSFRLNEILQMRLSDIEERQGIPCFVATLVEADGTRALDKKLKTTSSRRVVPVHSELLRIGFLRYVEQLRKDGQKRLFPEALQSGDTYYSTQFSKTFIRLLNRIRKRVPAFAVRRQSFHSLRHSFRDALREGRVDGELGFALGGWVSETTGDHYGDGFRAATLQIGIESLKYDGLDLSHLYWA